MNRAYGCGSIAIACALLPILLACRTSQFSGVLKGFLSRAEYDALCAVVANRFPEHLPEFIVSIHSGMRLTEQYSSTWSQVDFRRRIIDLTKTKNYSARTVHLNADAIAAIESKKGPRHRPG
jgi:integrase